MVMRKSRWRPCLIDLINFNKKLLRAFMTCALKMQQQREVLNSGNQEVENNILLIFNRFLLLLENQIKCSKVNETHHHYTLTCQLRT
jgi:hypothetical protein